MTYAIVLHRRALDDLGKILRWLKRRSKSGMEHWRDALDDCFLEIAKDPYRYAKVAEGSRVPAGIQQALFRTRQGNVYRVVFLVEQFEVRILRIRAPGQRNLRPRDLK
jgi:plasmid stabilization system protein ParE